MSLARFLSRSQVHSQEIRITKKEKREEEIMGVTR